MTLTKKVLEIYTDGACSGNPGPGGWAALLIWGDKTKSISGHEANTTNNRMEMMAAIKGLEQVSKSVEIRLTTDSQYVKNGITQWINTWLRNNWNGGKVKNQDLWLKLVELKAKHNIEWCWVKGHSGNQYNEQVDKLAVEAIKIGRLSSGN